MLLMEQFAPKPLNMPNKHLATKETSTKPSHVYIETEGSGIMDCICSCTNQDKSVVHCYEVAVQSCSLEFSVKLGAKGFWMSASAHVLCLPSIAVQLFRKYAKN